MGASFFFFCKTCKRSEPEMKTVKNGNNTRTCWPNCSLGALLGERRRHPTAAAAASALLANELHPYRPTGRRRESPNRPGTDTPGLALQTQGTVNPFLDRAHDHRLPKTRLRKRAVLASCVCGSPVHCLSPVVRGAEDSGDVRGPRHGLGHREREAKLRKKMCSFSEGGKQRRTG